MQYNNAVQEAANVSKELKEAKRTFKDRDQIDFLKDLLAQRNEEAVQKERAVYDFIKFLNKEIPKRPRRTDEVRSGSN